jgi:hypothetical protein
MKAYETVIRKVYHNMVDIDATGVIHFANFCAKFEQSQSKNFPFPTKTDDSVCQRKSGQRHGPRRIEFQENLHGNRAQVLLHRCVRLNALLTNYRFPDIQLGHFARAVGFLGMLGKGGNKLWTILLSFYWTKTNSFEIVDHANLLDGFSSTLARGDTIGTQHIQQILDVVYSPLKKIGLREYKRRIGYRNAHLVRVKFLATQRAKDASLSPGNLHRGRARDIAARFQQLETATRAITPAKDNH